MLRRILHIMLFILTSVSVLAQSSMSGYEYWLDSDYGGRVKGNSNAEEVSLSIDLSELPSGLHYYNVRCRNTEGEWGPVYRYMFLVPPSASTAGIARYESWFDGDYAHRTTSGASGESVVQSVDISSLPSGIHYYNVRCQNADGEWSAIYRYLFLIPPSASTAGIARYESWFDGDYAHRTTSGASSESVAQSLDISSLPSGIHYYNVRCQNTDGEWSALYRYMFYIAESGEVKLKAIQYWIDDDKDHSMILQTNVEEVVLSIDISQLEAGTHHLYYRIQDSSEEWGTEYDVEFSIDEVETVATPVISHEGNTVSITCETSESTIYYTTDGAEPTAESPVYTMPFTVERNGIIKAIALRNGYNPSAITTFDIDWFKVANPTFVQTGNLLTISTSTEYATLYYGIGEDATPKTLYTGPLTLTDEQVIKAVARRDGYNDSEVVTYMPTTVNTPMPVMAYNGRYLQLACPLPNAAIFYTLDGSEPTVQSDRYDTTMEIEDLCIVKAIAIVDGLNVSTVGTWNIDFLFDGITAHVRNDGTLAKAFEWCGSMTGADQVAAIIWDAGRPLTQTELASIDNPNLLVYVNEAELAPANVQNVVVQDVAPLIVLTEALEGNNNFFCPKAFKADSIRYTHDYQMQTQIGVSQGWETIALPFTVQTITHEAHGRLTPFGVNGGKPFWLVQMTEQGLASAQQIEAYSSFCRMNLSSRYSIAQIAG